MPIQPQKMAALKVEQQTREESEKEYRLMHEIKTTLIKREQLSESIVAISSERSSPKKHREELKTNGVRKTSLQTAKINHQLQELRMFRSP